MTKSIKKNRAIYASKTSMAALGLTLLLSAQGALAEAGAPENQGIEDIVVTAQRREQLAIKTPLSLSALDGNAIADRQIKGMVDLQFVSPGIRSGHQQGVNRIFIRGIGLTSFAAGADPSVAFYVDGVYVGRPTAQLSSFFDVERMEVLRGPQGALYGRNATGGAVNLITKAPDREFGGFVNLSAGNYGMMEGEAAINVPLSENGDLRARFSGHLLSRDGYGEDITMHHPVNDAHSQAARGIIQYNPSSAIDVKLVAEYTHENDNNNYTASFGAYPGYVLQGVAGTTDPDGVLLQGIAVINSQDAATALAGKTNQREGYAVTLDAKFELSDNFSLTSITGWRKFDRYNGSDSDGTSAGLGNTLYWENSKQVSQEIQFNYNSDNFNAVTGVTYYDETIDNHVLVPFIQFGPGVDYIQDGTMKIKAFAAYFQGTYSITPELRATAGVRYSNEKRTTVGTFTFLGLSDTSGSKKWTATNPKFGLEYDVAPNTMVYASVTNGFKSGTFNIGQVNPAINPEKIWAYEIGAKSRLLDNALEISGALFRYDYSDLQVNKVIGIATQTTNAASARNTGAELSIRARPVRQLTLDANFTYLDAKFTDFNSTNPLYPLGSSDPGLATFLEHNPGVAPPVFALDANGDETTEQVIKGNMLPGAPKYQATLGIQYDIPLANDSQISARADIAYSSRVHFSEFNDPYLSQKGVTKVNLALKYDSGKNWTLTVWGKNITNELVAANKLLTIQLWGYPIYGALEAPATFGGTLGVKF